MTSVLPFDRAAELLPVGLRKPALSMPQTERTVAEEFRLRVGRPLSVTFPNGEAILPDSTPVTPDDLRSVLELATQASAHTALERVRQGFFTVRGGHRIGLCGTAVVKDGEIHNLREISSLNIRIAKELPGIARDVLLPLCLGTCVPSVLILAPPGAGKTTLLRDMIRGLSSGQAGAPLRIGVADERGELGALYHGMPQMDLGPHTDIMDGCAKADGLIMLLRGMNPQVLAMDEITAPADVNALEMAAGCGVVLLATAHGGGRGDLERRPLYARLLERRIFQKLLIIERQNGTRHYRWEDLPC